MKEQSIGEGIGQKGIKLIGSLRETGVRVFKTGDAVKILGSNAHAVNILLSKLSKSKKILRLERGKYLIIPPEAWKSGDYLEQGIILASSLISPYYLSFWTALNYYGYTEQPSQTIFIACQRSRPDLNIKGLKFRFVKINIARFFGYESVWIGDQKVNIASREKLMLDCLTQPKYCGEIAEVAKGLWNGRKEINWKVLVDQAIQMKNSAILKRLGFLMEVLGIEKPGVIRILRENMSKGYSPLEPAGSKSGKYNERWKLFVNTSIETLTEWRKH